MYNCYLKVSKLPDDLLKILKPHEVFTDVSTVVHFTVEKLDIEIFTILDTWELYYTYKGLYGHVKENLGVEWANFDLVSDREKRFFLLYFNLGELDSSEG